MLLETSIASRAAAFMATLPFVAATAPPPSPSLKNPNILHQRNGSTFQLDTNSEPKNVVFRESLDYNYVPLLEECLSNNSVREARSVHAHIIKTGTHEDLYTMTHLVNVYGKCGSLEHARKLFDKLPTRNVAAWTALMSAYVNDSQPRSAIQAFQEMLQTGCFPSKYTLGVFLNACSSLRSTKLARQIHAYMIKYQIDCDSGVGNALCTFYCKSRMLECAVKAFWRIKEKDVISWTAVISACGENGDAARGIRFFSKMISEGIEPNPFTLTCVLSLCITTLSLTIGAQVHSLVIKLGYEADLAIRDSVMYLYLNCGFTNEAMKLFDGTKAILATWNSMIIGHSQLMDRAGDDLLGHLSGTEALTIFVKLKRAGLKPDMYSFSSTLTACNKMVAIDHGEQIHAQTIKTGYLSNVFVGTALLNMYAKCGSMERATAAFTELPHRTLVTWTNMITGFAYNGQSQQALQLFEDMRRAGVRPNQITFAGVLWACAQAGMVGEALHYFNMMQNEYELTPVMDHFTCLVDVFLRLGQLEEAFNVVKKMVFPPSEQIWIMLIAGCRIHGNVELGCFAANQLLQIKPKDADSYVMLLNMYKSAGRWEDVSRTRELMREEQIRMSRDWSWISIRDKIHFFKPCDPSHLCNADMNKLLEDLLVKAEALGYEPGHSAEVTDDKEEDSEPSRTVKSELLAVAFGMLNTRDGMPIGVLKSSRMCRDSHNFLEHMSLLTDRRIVVRDSKRLHIFVNGHCPCGGFGAVI